MGKKIFLSHIFFLYVVIPNTANTNLSSISDIVITSSTYSDSLREIKFIREVIYGDTDELFLGRLLAVEVDDLQRVYIADRDHVTIHVFNPDGSYLKPLGRQGQGPGEFLFISMSTMLEIHSNRLFVTDGDGKYIHRFHVFLLEDLSLLQTINLRTENRTDYDEDLKKYFPRWLYPLNDKNIIVAYTFIQSPEYHESERMIRYYLHNSDGDIISGPILEQKDRTYLVYRYPGIGNHTFSFPFFGKSLLAVSDDHLYVVRTEDLKVDIIDQDGKHVRTIQHPIGKVTLTRSGLINMYKELGMTRLDRYEGDDVALKMISEAKNLPDVWPALDHMLVDDKNRLWISTIVEDFDIYEWWVLDGDSGDIITKFEWPRDEPIEVIRNGYMYTRETDEETGLQQVVRYRIEMSEAE